MNYNVLSGTLNSTTFTYLFFVLPVLLLTDMTPYPCKVNVMVFVMRRVNFLKR